MRRSIRFVGRWLWRISGTFLILCALFVVFSQTEMFKRWLRNTIIDIANSELVGKLVIEDARMDIFHGIVLVHPRLYADGTLLFEAQELSVAYDLATITNRIGSVSELRIIRPRIFIGKSKQGIWNVDRVIKPKVDTTTTELPDFTVAIRSFQIEEGEIVVNDRTSPWSDGTTFDPLHIHLDNFNCNISVRAALRDHDFAVAVNGMSFKDKYGPLNVHDVKLLVRASKSGVDLQSLRVRVNKSDISLQAKINDIDFTQGVNDSVLRVHPIVGRIESDSIWGPDIKYFVNDVDLLDTYELNGNLIYNGNKLDISRMDLHAGVSRLSGQVIINNLNNHDHISLDVLLKNSIAQYADIRRRIRFVDLPELNFLSSSDLRYVHMKGDPEKKLSFVVDVSDKPGSFRGEMTLELNKSKFTYQADMKVINGDLSAITHDSFQKTNINGRVMFVGSGVTLQDLLGTYQIELDRSRVFNRPLRTMRTLIKADGKGLINIDTLFADFTPLSDDTTVADPFKELSSQRIGLNASIDASDTAHLKYIADIKANGLDMASLLDDPDMPSRLSWQFQVEGSGTDIDSVQGTIKGRVNELMLANRSMMPFNLEFTSKKIGNSREIEFASDFASVFIGGEFVPSALIKALETTAKSAVNVVQQRINNIVKIDSIRPIEPISLESMNADVTLNILDISPLNMVVPDVNMSGSTSIKGSIGVTPSEVSIEVDTIATHDLSIVAEEVDIYTDPIFSELKIVIDNHSLSPTVKMLRVKGRCDSVLRVGKTLITRPLFDIEDQEGKASLVGSAWVNDMAFSVAAKALFRPEKILVEFDTASFVLDTANKLSWSLSQPTPLSITSGTYSFNNFKVQRKWSETIIINGEASTESFKDLNITVNQFYLQDLPRFINISAEHPIRFLGGQVDTLNLTVNGSWQEPIMLMTMNASKISYNGSLIGNLKSQLIYKNRDITGYFEIRDEDTTKKLRALRMDVNALPFDLALGEVEERLVPGKPVDVSVSADDLALAAVEPFVPAIERLRGKVDATVTLKGTSPDDLHLGGHGKFEKAKFIATSTNMEYVADGVLRLKEQDLFLDSVQVYNTQRDMPGGIAQANGVVNFDGFSVKSFDFTITTPTAKGVKIMNRASQVRSPNVFGDLIIATGSSGLHFYGPLDAPKLSGEVIVNYANLTMPKERSATRARESVVRYIRKGADTMIRENILEYYKPVVFIADTSVPDTTKSKIETAVKKAAILTTPKFADIIYYDLDIYMRGRVFITMILGDFEVLIADLSQVDYTVPLEFTGKFADNSTNLIGRVRVKEGASTYQFYKPFRTYGTLDFSAGGLTNPTLDLIAIYENRRYRQTTGSDQGTQETYKVQLIITGTKQFPRIAYRLWKNEREIIDDSSQIAADALSLILFGQTQAELVTSGQGSIANQAAALSAVASSALGDIVGGNGTLLTNFSVDVGSDLSTSTLTVTGQVIGDLSYRVTGQVSDFSGNSTFTVTLPLSTFNDSKLLRLLQLDFSRTLNNTGNITRQTRLWEIKFGARVP